MDIYNYSVFAYSYSVSCVRRFDRHTERHAWKPKRRYDRRNVRGRRGFRGGEQSEKTGLSGGQIAGIVIGSVLLAGIGGFAIFWFAVKKKKFADLIALFKKK